MGRRVTPLNTVTGFLSEGVVFDITAWTERPLLCAAYRSWCQRSGRLPVAAAKFYERLRNAHPDQIDDRIREGIRGFAGIRLRDPGASS